jgi:hypothetical protein
MSNKRNSRDGMNLFIKRYIYLSKVPLIDLREPKFIIYFVLFLSLY